jgi:hypothetical protein
MILQFIALAAASQATPTNPDIIAQHALDTVYNRSTYEAACGDTPIVIRFGNDKRRNRKGLVESVQVEGAEVAGAATRLTDLAVNRFIDRIGVMNCGYRQQRPVIRGVMEAAGSPRLSPNVFFTIRKESGAWVFSDEGVRVVASP